MPMENFAEKKGKASRKEDAKKGIGTIRRHQTRGISDAIPTGLRRDGYLTGNLEGKVDFYDLLGERKCSRSSHANWTLWGGVS